MFIENYVTNLVCVITKKMVQINDEWSSSYADQEI
jgi:hypothetical protein